MVEEVVKGGDAKLVTLTQVEETADVVHMWYEGSMKDEYRLARVVEVFPDSKGLVRTVRVRYRKYIKNEPRDICKPSCVEEKVAVQRLQLIHTSSGESEVGSTCGMFS